MTSLEGKIRALLQITDPETLEWQDLNSALTPSAPAYWCETCQANCRPASALASQAAVTPAINSSEIDSRFTGDVTPAQAVEVGLDLRCAIYERLCAAYNQDVPLEEYPERIIEAIARFGYAIVPCALPFAVLGEAAMTGVFETGNPKHGWDYLLGKTRVYPLLTTPQPAQPSEQDAVGYEITWNDGRKSVSVDPCHRDDGTFRPLTYAAPPLAGQREDVIRSLPAKWRGTNGADLPPHHPEIGGQANNGRFYLDQCADQLEAALTSQQAGGSE